MKWLKVRKKPVVVEAFQLKREMAINGELVGLPIKHVPTIQINFEHTVWFEVNTPEGKMKCREGDYIIKGVKGEYYPIKKEIFEETYEIIDDPEFRKELKKARKIEKSKLQYKRK